MSDPVVVAAAVTAGISLLIGGANIAREWKKDAATISGQTSNTIMDGLVGLVQGVQAGLEACQEREAGLREELHENRQEYRQEVRTLRSQIARLEGSRLEGT